jgi:LmbE family N-acetylglucosaminyl deacetylase
MKRDPFYKHCQILLNYIVIRIFGKKVLITKVNSILLLAPHPDDEIFGMGGFILRMLSNKSKINIIFLTDGEGSGIWHEKEEIRKQRIALSEDVGLNLGLNNSDFYRLHLPDGSVPHPGQKGFEEAVESVKEIVNSLKPDAVFTTHPLDYWPFDHVACAHIAKEAVKQSEAKPQLWYYWVWAWYNIRPWTLSYSTLKRLQKINIRDQIDHKKDLMDIYLNALTPDGKPWGGILPLSLLKVWSQPFEIFEKIELSGNSSL